ncbi:MAG: ROK family transcriptional regulator [Candidatus Omnitrophota bacterium]
MKTINFEGEVLTERARRNLAILETIRRSGPISKTDISKLIGLNVATISNYIDEFLAKNIVMEKALDVSGGGRRPLLLDLNANRGVAIGVGLNLLHLVGAITDLNGKVLYSLKKDKPQLNVKDFVQSIVKIVGELIKEAKKRNWQVEGVGIGIAGIVDKDNETVFWPQKISEEKTDYVTVYLPLKDIIEREFGVNAFIDNDATLGCFGEQWLTLSADIKHLLYLFSGVGCGIMINGEIYRGASGGAGEISISNTKDDNLFNCDFGCPCLMKRIEADLGILASAKSKLLSQAQLQNSSLIMELAGGDISKIDLPIIFQAVRQQDQLAINLVGAAAKRLGVKVAYLVNIFNPQLVIIGGGLEEAGNILFDTIRQTINEWSFKEMAQAVKVIPSRLGENAIALGAASLVVRNMFIRA